MATTSLLQDYADHKGRQITKTSGIGGWKSAIPLIGVEIAAGSAYVGITMNLINYLTSSLLIPTAIAAEVVNLFNGIAAFLPLLGAFVADSYLGRYRTILFSTLLCIAATAMISLSAGLPYGSPDHCKQTGKIIGSCSSPSLLKISFFFISIYILALGRGGQAPSTQAFGAGQFDANDPLESRSQSSFFNWWFLGFFGGSILGSFLISYVQEGAGWSIGFAVSCFLMGVSLCFLLLGRSSYRHELRREKWPLMGVVKGSVLVARKRFGASFSSTNSRKSTAFFFAVDETSLLQNTTNRSESVVLESQRCSFSTLEDKQVEEANSVIRLLPVLATSLIFPVVYAQCTTFFIKQSNTMDRRIFGFQVPAVALQSLMGLIMFIVIPIYDRIFVPVARKFTGIPSGITVLQRIGIGMFCSLLSMIVAAFIEMKRLRIARELGLLDLPATILPMTAWWMIPTAILLMFSLGFSMVGLQEFFYDQVPDGLKSLGISLNSTIAGVGSLLSGLLVFVVDKLSKKMDGESWLNDNINRAHLDYFYLLLAGLNLLELGLFMLVARCYVYRERGAAIDGGPSNTNDP